MIIKGRFAACIVAASIWSAATAEAGPSCAAPFAPTIRLAEAPAPIADARSDGARALAEGRYEDAERYFIEADKKATNPRERADALANLGLAQLMLGDARRAHASLTRAIDLGAQSGATSIVARSRYNLALLALSLSEPGEGDDPDIDLFKAAPAGEARSLFHAAAADARKAGSSDLAFRADIGALRSGIVAGELPAVRVEFAALRTAPTSPFAKLALADAGRRVVESAPNARESKLVADAVDQLLSDVAKSSDNRLVSQAHGIRASLRLAQSDLTGGMAAARRALLLAEAEAAEDLRFRWLAQIGEIHRRRGDNGAALSAFESAQTSVERVRSNLPQFDPVTGRSLFRETVGPIYLALAGLYVQQGRDSGEVAESGQKSLYKARTTIEVLKQVETEQFFRDECVAAALEQRTALEDILVAEPTSIAIYPIIMPEGANDRITLLALRGAKLSIAQVTLPQGELRRTILRFRKTLIENAYDIEPVRQDGAQLYDWLVRPLESALGGADTLVFIPDGPLRLLPWSALVDRKTNQYLVQKYAVANSIGLSLTAPRPIAGIPPRVLAAGFAAETTDPDTGRKFDALQTVDEELDALQVRFPGAVRRLPGALSHAALRKALDDEPYTIVHLATHAKFRASLRDTFLLAADGKITLDNLSSLIKPARIGGQPIELLSLSACETAAGNDRASLGLAGVALKAGARSVAASLWPINDRATPIFFDAFYEALAARKLSKAKAVRQAQLHLLKGDVPAFAHPHYWAPFVVIGNWQ